MKRFSLILVLLIIVSTLSHAKRQSLRVDSPAPSLLVLKWAKGTPIDKYIPNRFYLIEFGATWCRPCAEAIPELASIQSEFKEQVTVASIFVKEDNKGNDESGNPSYVASVERYINKRSDKINYTIGIDNPAGSMDKEWLQAAYLTGIPHIFLIDGHGIIRWIGVNPAKAKQALTSLVENKKITTSPPEKYDRDKLLLIDDNGGKQSDFIFRSILTFYDGKIFGYGAEHLVSYQHYKPDSIYDKKEDRLQIIGRSVGQLYYIAHSDTLPNNVPVRVLGKFADTIQLPYTKSVYGKFWHQPIFEVSDKRIFEYNSRSTRNRFNYSLKVPKGTGTALFLQKAMQRDLKTYFGFDVEIQTRSMPYWKLIVADKKRATAYLIANDQSKDYLVLDTENPFIIRNAEMRDMIAMLGAFYGYGSFDSGKVPPELQGAYLDETGITSKVDFQFNREWSFEQCQQQLKQYGLELVRSSRNMKVIVIKDPRPSVP